MPPRIDLTGQRFGRLLVLEEAGRLGRDITWCCRCDCGELVTARGRNLRDDGTHSCGCLHRERTSAAHLTHGQARVRAWTKEYRAWTAMVARCTRPSQQNYPKYGGRGITVCPEWLQNFGAFFAHVGVAPSPKHSLDRIDPQGHYEPGNVRWATGTEQRLNQRRRVARGGPWL